MSMLFYKFLKFFLLTKPSYHVIIFHMKSLTFKNINKTMKNLLKNIQKDYTKNYSKLLREYNNILNYDDKEFALESLYFLNTQFVDLILIDLQSKLKSTNKLFNIIVQSNTLLFTKQEQKIIVNYANAISDNLNFNTNAFLNFSTVINNKLVGIIKNELPENKKIIASHFNYEGANPVFIQPIKFLLKKLEENQVTLSSSLHFLKLRLSLSCFKDLDYEIITDNELDELKEQNETLGNIVNFVKYDKESSVKYNFENGKMIDGVFPEFNQETL